MAIVDVFRWQFNSADVRAHKSPACNYFNVTELKEVGATADMYAE